MKLCLPLTLIHLLHYFPFHSLLTTLLVPHPRPLLIDATSQTVAISFTRCDVRQDGIFLNIFIRYMPTFS